MIATSRNALNAYSKVSVETGLAEASPHKLIAMLFEGATVAVASARSHMQLGNIAEKGRSITMAIAIIDEGLKLSLDENMGGEIAQNLKALYGYMCQRLLEANLRNEIEGLEEVGRLLSDLKGAWDSIEKPQAAAAPSPAEQAPDRAARSYGVA